MAPDHSATFFLGKYRNASARCAPWDYTSAAAYFVTINTRDRVPWLGEVRNGIMHLSTIGCIVDECWRTISAHHPYVTVDAHVVMPDHVHGIVIIHPHPRGPGPTTNRFGPLRSGSLPAIIGSFKSACTKRIHGCKDAACRVPTTAAPSPTDGRVPASSTPPPGIFAWQPRYHDRIIRDTDALHRIRTYIRMNPRRWDGRS